jgi:hypothetical protein
MPHRRFTSPKPVRRKLVVRFDVDMREQLDRIGADLGLVRQDTGRPRDAELVRLLLVCGLLGPRQTNEAKVAVAVHVNAEVALSSELVAVASRLRDGILATSAALAAASLKKAGSRDQFVDGIDRYLEATGPRPPLVGSRSPRPRREEGSGVLLEPDRTRVHLALDGWLFRALVRYATGSAVAGKQPRSLGAEAVRQLLWSAVQSYAAHEAACRSYLVAIDRMRATIVSATEAGQVAIAEALSR